MATSFSSCGRRGFSERMCSLTFVSSIPIVLTLPDARQSPKSCNLVLGTLLRGRETVDIHVCYNPRCDETVSARAGKAKGEDGFIRIL